LAESRSVSSLNRKASSGLVVHLLLLSTPSRDDAVAVGYRFTFNLDEDVHLSSPAKCALRRTVRAAQLPLSSRELVRCLAPQGKVHRSTASNCLSEKR